LPARHPTRQAFVRSGDFQACLAGKAGPSVRKGKHSACVGLSMRVGVACVARSAERYKQWTAKVPIFRAAASCSSSESLHNTKRLTGRAAAQPSPAPRAPSARMRLRRRPRASGAAHAPSARGHGPALAPRTAESFSGRGCSSLPLSFSSNALTSPAPPSFCYMDGCSDDSKFTGCSQA
jgi:hypothetical protein